MRTETRAQVLREDEERPLTDEQVQEALRLVQKARNEEGRDYVSVVSAHKTVAQMLDPLIDDPTRTLAIRSSGYAHGDIQVLVLAWLSEALTAVNVAEQTYGELPEALANVRHNIDVTLNQFMADLIAARKAQRGVV